MDTSAYVLNNFNAYPDMVSLQNLLMVKTTLSQEPGFDSI